jgi:hypothetical protein
MEYGEPILYFHFYTAGGLPASMPMFKELAGIGNLPGVTLTGVPDSGAGYRCPCCNKVFYAADTDGLKHGCMNNGGLVSERA